MTDLKTLRAAAYAASTSIDHACRFEDIRVELREMARLGMIPKRLVSKALTIAPEYLDSDLGVSELCDLLVELARIR